MPVNLFVIRAPDGTNVNQARQRTIDAFTLIYDYRATLPDGTPNPETPAQFTHRKIVEFIKKTRREARVRAAEQAARDSAAAQADNENEELLAT